MLIDCKYTSEIVCPYCGDRWSDSWDVDFGIGVEGDAELYCDECEKYFFAERYCKITYSTVPL